MACAEAIETWGPSTRINSEPAVARCNLDGEGLQRVVVTPVRVVLPKNASPVTVTCSAEGYYSSAHQLITTISSNLLLGSTIGIAVDIMSGAAEQYPSRIMIHLEPKSFSSAARRDQWFARFRTSLEGKWNGIVENLRIACEEDLESSVSCREEHAQAMTDREVALTRLDRRRDQAVIGTKTQARNTSHNP